MWMWNKDMARLGRKVVGSNPGPGKNFQQRIFHFPISIFLHSMHNTKLTHVRIVFFDCSNVLQELYSELKQISAEVWKKTLLPRRLSTPMPPQWRKPEALRLGWFEFVLLNRLNLSLILLRGYQLELTFYSIQFFASGLPLKWHVFKMKDSFATGSKPSTVQTWGYILKVAP